MIFCGQCGMQLAPGTTRCPRCGAIAEAAVNTVRDFQGDAPTQAAQFVPPQQARVSSPQQPFILRSNPTTTPVPESYEAPTRQMSAPNTDVRSPYSSQPGFPSQPVNPQQYVQQVQPTQEAIQHPYTPNTQYQTPNPHTGYVNPNFQSGNYQADTHQSDSYAKGRVTGLVLILLGLLFVIGAIAIFAYGNHLLTPGSNNTKAYAPQTIETSTYITQVNPTHTTYTLWQQTPPQSNI